MNQSDIVFNLEVITSPQHKDDKKGLCMFYLPLKFW
jgi:hypothetical protein